MNNFNFMDSTNTNFYFQQNFRNYQIKIIYSILKLPKTKENNRFINKLLIQTNRKLFDYYYKLKPSYIDTEIFLKKLGNKGIVETVKQIMFIIKQKEIDDTEELLKQKQEQEIKQQQQKQNIEQIQRPTFSNFLNKDNEDPENTLNRIKEERLKFDQTLPNYQNPKTPEDVGLIPQQTKKNKFKHELNNKSFNNFNEVQETREIKQNNNIEAIPKTPNINEQPNIQQQNINNQQTLNKFINQENQPVQSLVYNVDEFKPIKTTEKIDFTKPIDQSLLMPNLNSGEEDTNYSQF